MTINSKEKGKRGEREVAELFQSAGYDARRTAQVRGKTDGMPDVEGVPGLWVEVKRNERLNVSDAIAQAVRDTSEAGSPELPTAIHRKNGEEWLVTMRFSDWIKLYHVWEIYQEDTRD